MSDSPQIATTRFSVTPVKADDQQEISVVPITTISPPMEDEEVPQDIDDIGYITCERYDKPRRNEDDSDDEEAGYMTYEAMPRETNYVLSLTRAGKARPTIMELRLNKSSIDQGETGSVTQRDSNALLVEPATGGMKFGWIRGVFIRCLLNIWGVLLFMRLSWVVAQAGLGLTVAILVLACAVTTVTTLSMSAISTNGAVQGGGTYFLISRSLGPEFGGAVGIVFSLANAVAVGMNTVGFAEALVELLTEHNVSMLDPTNDIRIIGLLTMLLLLGITIVGMEWEARTQIVLFGVIIGSLINFFVGSFISVSDDKQAKGITGYSADVFSENFFPSFRDGHSFMTVFAIFFPACTGIMAGANISGDLKNPAKAIPRGTLGAIGVSGISYLACALVVAAVAVRDASGSVRDFFDGNVTACYNGTNGANTCKWGTANSYQMMTEISAVGPIITTGVFAASLSSALACLVSAPKIFQALSRDNIFPYIEFFGRGFGKNDEPRWAYLLTFVIGCGIVLIADLNAIAPIISNFYIGTYALINYACFDASLSASPGFRPGFRYYNMWLSLLGSGLCVACMFMMNWWGALITMAVIAFLWGYVHHKAPDVNWGSSIQARAFKSTVQSALKLMGVEDHVKNFRPQVLVLSGLPSSRPALVYFVNSFTKNTGMMICGDVLVGATNLHIIPPLQKQTYSWFREKHIKSFYSAIVAKTFREGVRALIQTVGIGKMRPNMVMMGFNNLWMYHPAESVEDYLDTITDSLDANMGVGILRVQEGMDVSQLLDFTGSTYDLLSLSTRDETVIPQTTNGLLAAPASQKRKLSFQDTSRGFSMHPSGLMPTVNENGPPAANGLLQPSSPLIRCRSELNIFSVEAGEAPVSQSQYTSRLDLADKFHNKTKQKMKGEIHVYWLYDDGGLTLLIPHLLSKKQPWNGCKLKIFYLQGKPHQVDEAQRNMVALLSKFRIDFVDAVAVNSNKPPSEESVIWFNQMIQPFRVSDISDIKPDESVPTPISNEDLESLFERTQRQIRLREVLKENSSDAELIVMTLPVPKRNCNPTLYMAWLETLTKDMPPFLLLRGNQQSVMTFYT
ncbi:solute carrier family 12 member 2-like [Paramacrobiotus metropolitanus]|uniref:solute carrier family 12 member 2-like n=1 Tax=Paramacrobiotus metropolitanus TaxID=2943436 RepID=UPI002446240B|nr:solute carrier family 12 member 2-like [Paramacrobiotus metropolitanus]